jgi:diguanylate cyclase (GGDEF)-like protein/PAS domain S-box-containing protein
MWLLAMLVLAGVMAYSLGHHRAEILSEQQAQLLAQTRLIDANLSRQLEATDRVLLATREELAALPADQRFAPMHSQHLMHRMQALTGVRTLLVLDATGTARLSNRLELLGGNFSHRDYFRLPQQTQDPVRIYLSAPFKTVLNVWAMNLSRVIQGPQGEFLGVVTATLDYDYFVTLLGSVRFAEDMRVVMIHGDGRAFFGVPKNSVVVGQNVLRPGTYFEQHLKSGRDENVFAGITPVSQEWRLTVFNTIHPAGLALDRPLVISISRDLDDVFTLWYADVRTDGWIFALIALSSGLALWVTQRGQRRNVARLARVDAQLKDEHDQLNEAQRLARLGSWTLDLRSNRLQWSNEIFRLFEVDPCAFQASYQGFLQAIHPEDRDAVDQAFTHSLATRQPYEITHRLRMADGRIKWVHERCRTEYDDQGAAVRSLGTVQDITDIKQAQDALQASEQRARMLTDNAADAVLIASPQERWVYVNDRVADLLGYAPSELLGKSVYELVPPSKRDLYREGFHHLKDGTPSRAELRLIHKDGHRIPVEMNAVRLPDGNVYGACRDFSERQRIEEELRVAAVAFETEEGILITNEQGVILRVNQAFTRISGYAAEEVIGKTPALLQSGRQDEAFYRMLWTALKQDDYWEGEVWNRRKNGEIYPEWLTITGVKDLKGKTSHYVAVFSDITERKASEEKIHRLAFYDPLTQLPNRRLLHDRCAQALRSSARHKNHGAVLFLDLDRFKTLNDTRGHEAGDLLLVEVARRMLACVRAEDTVARMGGDEFVVVLEELSTDQDVAREQAVGVAEKIRLALDQPYVLGEFTHSSSPSIGVCLFGGGRDITVNELLMHADQAMYQAKAAGRNTVRVFEG